MADKKRILWVHTQPEYYVNLMIDALNKCSEYQYDTAYIYRGHGLYSELAVPKTGQHFFLDPGAKFSRPDQLTYWFRRPNWEKVIDLNAYSALVVAGYAGATQRSIFRVCSKYHIPVAMMCDSNLRSDRGKTPAIKFKRLVKRICLQHIIQSVDVLMPANSLGNAYWRYYGAPRHKIKIAACYADYDRIKESLTTDRKDVLPVYDISSDRNIILSAARLIPVKGLELMIRAFRELKLGEKGFVYAIAGVGPLEAELKALAGEENGKGIRFLGFVQPKDLMKLMVHSSLFVLPSHYEPHGIVIGEAAAAGTPQLVSDVCGAAKDVVVEGVSGWTFKTGDPNSFTQKLNMVLSDMPRLENMRESSRRTWEEWFKWSNPVVVVDQIVHELIEKKSKAATR